MALFSRAVPARRIDPPVDEVVTLRVDGDEVRAVRGEPVALSLWAAGRIVLGRSVKYHRPRGAACFAGRCDGCAMRVNGVPSVRTCRVPAREGLVVETQNVLGSAEVDVLAATDWLFPSGMNHHEMFTWARPVNELMQRVARQVAGVGRLPDAPASLSPVESKAPDVLVIGAGPAGLVVAAVLGRAGLRVLCVDEESAPGGRLRWSPEPSHAALAAALAEEAVDAGVELLVKHAVVGIFDEVDEGRVAIVAPSFEAAESPRAMRVRASAWVIATGRAEGAEAFAGNDLPGVVVAEAAARALSHGVLLGERIAIAGDLATRRTELRVLADALRAAGASVDGPRDLDELDRAHGRGAVRAVTWNDKPRSRGSRKVDCDLLVVGGRTSANYELAMQAGARAELRNGAFEILHAPGAHGLWVVGGAAGIFGFETCSKHAVEIGLQIAAALGAASRNGAREAR